MSNNNLQRTGGAAVQLWQALPIWAKVVGGLVAAVALYYSFFFLLGLLFLSALGVGVVTIARWLLTR